MHSVEIGVEQIRTAISIIPRGVEHYVISKNGHRFINIRTDDTILLSKVLAAGRSDQ